MKNGATMADLTIHLPLKLVEMALDNRRGKRRKVAVFCPVGDSGQLERFRSHVKKLGIGRIADFIFIYRKGVPYQKGGLHALHATEKYPLGTSGCFFAGQLLAYRLGYETIVVTDLDAFLDSRKSFDKMLSMCRAQGKVISPVSANEGNPGVFGANSLNHWSFFPREAFEEVGFSIPFFWRGGDDYELLWRYKSRGKMVVYKEGCVFHPLNGHTIFHKMLERKKHYPYVASLLKALLYMKDYSKNAVPKFFFWYAYYSYFADAFGDGAFLSVLKNSSRFARPSIADSPAQFFLEPCAPSGKFEAWSMRLLASTMLSPFTLSIFGEYRICADRVVYSGSRAALFLRATLAAILVPLRLLQAGCRVMEWDSASGIMHRPDMRASKAEAAEAEFERFLKGGGLAI